MKKMKKLILVDKDIGNVRNDVLDFLKSDMYKSVLKIEHNSDDVYIIYYIPKDR